MAKKGRSKGKGKVVQMLSPENYIRKRARNLEIHECWINQNWKDLGQAEIILVRRHSNGNFTVGLFLVDLYCLGIRDAGFNFNILPTELEEFMDTYQEHIDLEEIDYVLAHNILFSALEFAEEYGFKPCKDFTSTMQYFLEEHTDDIELMEIECGKNGKPLFISSPAMSRTEVANILAHLEKTVGEGNYYYVDSLNSDEFDDEFDDEFEDDPFTDLSFDEKLDLYKKRIPDVDNSSENDLKESITLIGSILDE